MEKENDQKWDAECNAIKEIVSVLREFSWDDRVRILLFLAGRYGANTSRKR